MATTPNSIITPQTVGNGVATLTSPTAVTSRANIAGTTGLVQLKAAPTNGAKVYEISYKCKGTSSAAQIFIWKYDGTTSYLFDEIPVAAVTPSATVASDNGKKTYANLTLKTTESLYVSVSVAQDLTVFAAVSDL